MNMSDIRIGHGYDVHRLTEGRRLILGGVDIPHARGLDGHSDADVLTHALCDAMLGALALGEDLREHGLGLPQLLTRGDHWEHNVQIAIDRRTQQRPKLDAEEILSLQAQPDRAEAEERIVLFRQR